MRDPNLWARLSTYSFDASGEMLGSFQHRLAQETGWSLSYAGTVLEEYRRFLYLSAINRGPLMAPKAIDRVWRFHLGQRRDYRERLCGEVLQRPLHHVAYVAGEGKSRHQMTRALYAEEFRGMPPRSVWPDPELLERRQHMALTATAGFGAAFFGLIGLQGVGELGLTSMLFVCMVCALMFGVYSSRQGERGF